MFALRGESSQTHGMKPKRQTKAPAKRTRVGAKTETAKAEPMAESPIRAAVRKIKAAISTVKKRTAAVKPAAAKRTRRVTPSPVAAEPTSTPARIPAAVTRKKLTVPPILLEGDASPASRPSGPGERYAIGTAEITSLESDTAELPEAYGTERLLLVARDPHWLYAHWDLTGEQLRKRNAASRDKHLVVRVFLNQPAGKPLVEQHVHPESRNWFLHVGRGGTKYVAQLGYYDRKDAWKTIATSDATLTPPDVLSDDTSVRFETIPIEVPFDKLLALVKDAVMEHKPLVEVIQQLREAGYSELPALTGGRESISHWTPEQERALAQIISIDEVRRVWMGSLEITELLRRSLEREISSQAAAAFARGELAGVGELGGVFSVSSPFGGEQRRKGFWFNVNAELIIYGATEPDANVTIGGRKIQLRRDGSFSFRFALPDGNYDLPVQATSVDNSDSRQAKLQFRRATDYRGDVGAHPQDAKLKTPRVESVA